MAKYEVTYSCGHSDTVTLFGPHKERDRKLEWMKTTLCPACYKAEQARLREERNRKNAEEAKNAGLAPITEGSEKQNGWAETIRAKVFKVLANDFTKEYVDGSVVTAFTFSSFVTCAKKVAEESAHIPGISEKLIPSLQEKIDSLSEADFEAFKVWMGAKTDPKFWIDSRDAAGILLFQIRNLEKMWLRENGWKLATQQEAEKAYWKWEFDKEFENVPQKPDFLAGYWNGKIYSGKRIYLGGEEKILSDSEHEALKTWIKYSAGPGKKEGSLEVSEFPAEFVEDFVKSL
ncbi:MAG: hypothetical protein J5736_03820 [Bacilli bacterium]|nr:hypothetical protein [Bacilli bacterium]